MEKGQVETAEKEKLRVKMLQSTAGKPRGHKLERRERSQ
jgi:hypothetical protein